MDLGRDIDQRLCHSELENFVFCCNYQRESLSTSPSHSSVLISKNNPHTLPEHEYRLLEQ